jgi:ferredoxin
MKRKIIEIDRDLCNGCAQCTTACAEGALVMDGENKAVLAKEIFCDGLGACLSVCPTGALTVIEREAEAFDEAAVEAHVGHASHAGHVAHGGQQGCPGQAMRSFAPAAARQVSAVRQVSAPGAHAGTASELAQWPVQLHLISPQAPYFNECDLLIAADCTAFALGSFHADLLRGKRLAIACPKLDDSGGYLEKLAELIRSNTIYSITVAIMEVPCCRGLKQLVTEAVRLSGKNIAVKTVVVGISGGIATP